MGGGSSLFLLGVFKINIEELTNEEFRISAGSDGGSFLLWLLWILILVWIWIYIYIIYIYILIHWKLEDRKKESAPPSCIQSLSFSISFTWIGWKWIDYPNTSNTILLLIVTVYVVILIQMS